MEINPKMIAQILEQNKRTKGRVYDELTTYTSVKSSDYIESLFENDPNGRRILANKTDDPQKKIEKLEKSIKELEGTICNMRAVLLNHFDTMDKIIICNGEYIMDEE